MIGLSEPKKSFVNYLLAESSKLLIAKLNLLSNEEIIMIPDNSFETIKYNVIKAGQYTHFSLPFSKNKRFYLKLLKAKGSKVTDFESVLDENNNKLYIQLFTKVNGIVRYNDYKPEDIVNLYLTQHGIEIISLKDRIVKITLSNGRYYYGNYNGIICDIPSKSIRFIVGNTSYNKVLPSLSHSLVNTILNS